MGFSKIIKTVAAAGLLSTSLWCMNAEAAWEPENQVEFVVPFGSGGGADQMARLIKAIIENHKLMSQPMVIVNKTGNAGADGLNAIKNSAGDPHKIILTLSNVYIMPLATGSSFNWRDITPVAMPARDQFILWTNADKYYSSAREYIAAVKAREGGMTMGGTGARQEDEILTLAIQKTTGATFSYIPLRSGGEVAAKLENNEVESTVNNPVEAVAQWRNGKLRPLCVFDDVRIPYKNKVTATLSWNDIPTCKEGGLPLEYKLLRGIFMPPGVTPDQFAYYVGLLKKVVETPEWKSYMEKGVFDPTFMSGTEFSDWLTKDAALHKQLMTEAGFVK